MRRDLCFLRSLYSLSSCSNRATLSGNASFKPFITSLVPGPISGIVVGRLEFEVVSMTVSLRV